MQKLVERQELKMLSSMESKVVRMAGFDQLYFIGYEGDDADAPIKIGFTGNAKTRIGAIQSSNWRKAIVHEVFHLRSRMDIVSKRRFKLALSSGDDDVAAEVVSKATESICNILHVEQEVHAECKRQGLHHSREWFFGGVERLTGIASSVIARQFQCECYPHSSMLEMMKRWKAAARVG